MDAKAIDQLLESQRQYFLSGATLPVEFRIAMLQRLRSLSAVGSPISARP